MLWQLTPLGRPWRALDVQRQFAAQTHPDKKFCLVTSGSHWEGVNVARRLAELGVKPDLLIEGPSGKGPALNAGVEELAKRNASVLVRDDDDIYLPGGMSEFAALLPDHDIIAQRRHWVVSDGRLLLFGRDDHSKPLADHVIWGGNFAFRANDAVPFSDDAVTQCCDWMREMRRNGADAWHKSPHHAAVYRGEPDHLWRAGEMMLRERTGDAERFPSFDPSLVSGDDQTRGEWLPAPTVREAHMAEISRLCAQ